VRGKGEVVGRWNPTQTGQVEPLREWPEPTLNRTRGGRTARGLPERLAKRRREPTTDELATHYDLERSEATCLRPLFESRRVKPVVLCQPPSLEASSIAVICCSIPSPSTKTRQIGGIRILNSFPDRNETVLSRRLNVVSRNIKSSLV
jgi:hypothetical protein